jgi:hypothetical protein
MPRVVVLHGECAGCPKDGWNSPDRAGDIEAKEHLQRDNGGLRWSLTISDTPCRLEGEREVSEGRGLGEEMIGGRRTGERESGGAGQIPMDDGAPVLGRATRMSTREGGAWIRWLGCG